VGCFILNNMNHFDNPDKALEIRDKLEYLFEMQKSLITQDYNSTKIKSNEEIPRSTRAPDRHAA